MSQPYGGQNNQDGHDGHARQPAGALALLHDTPLPCVDYKVPGTRGPLFCLLLITCLPVGPDRPGTSSKRFHYALQGMLLGTRILRNLRDAGGRDIARVHAAYTAALMVYLQHDSCGFFLAFTKKFLQHADDEFHRRVIVIQQYDLIHGGGAVRAASFSTTRSC